MADGAPDRKLASIVAIDLAGYSRQTEADEDAAVRAVAALRVRVGNSAKTHGGRVFNAAGDGFMLEFPSAFSALAAAEEIASAADPPVRTGVHLGDVSVTAAGDLLGHGVNIAARIQQLAAPGAVLVSGDVKRAIRGPLGARLTSQGSVKLDKMSETLPVFALAPADGRRARGRRLTLKAPVAAGAGGALVALAGLALWPGHGLIPATEARPSRLAILPFESMTSSQQERSFATGIADTMHGVLSAGKIPVVSRQEAAALRGPDQVSRLQQLGVRLLFDGTVTTERDTLHVRVHLEDVGHHVTLWSEELSGPAANPDALEAQVGARAIAVMNCGGQALQPEHGLSDPQALGLYLQACDLFARAVYGDDTGGVYSTLNALRESASHAPRFAPAHSALARFLAGYREADALRAEPRIAAEADREARRALDLNAKDADAFVALSLLRPTSDYAGREKLLDQALAADPSWAYANLEKANLLFDVGRYSEGVTAIQRAAAANPLNLNITTDFYLVGNGQTAAGNAELERLQRLWPHSERVWWDRLLVYGMEKRWNELLTLLADRQSTPKSWTDSEIGMFRAGFLAEERRTPALIAEARRQFLTAQPRGPEQLITRFETLADLGLTDDAFRLAGEWSKAPLTAFNPPQYLFFPDRALHSGIFPGALRRDPRFMGLAAKLGLVDYWRATGTWPNFCFEPGLPYDCKVEAAKAVRRS